VSSDDHEFQFNVGTLIEDMGKLGIITRVLASGALKTDVSAIKWRTNYEISYNDGDIQIIAESTFMKLVTNGVIKILSEQN
tara:strand:- start:1216 stop:1458 length:243 start_codon:yes stop_codon:yes gene_type:complete